MSRSTTADARTTRADAFVGRQEELDLLRAALEDVRSGSPRVVLLEGAPGMGKTALLRRFLAEATGVRVLRAGGEHEEHLLGYGVVDQLARSAQVPLTGDLAALGRSASHSPEAFTVGAALVDLLGSLQEHGPVAVVVDDAQWADRASLLALLFALRRLQADRVLALVAIRDEDVADLPQGLRRLVAGERGTTLRLRGLDAGELQELAAGTIDECLPVELAQQLRDHSGGNPLHIRALLEELPLERLRRASDAPLPSPRSFSVQVLSRLAGCPVDTRRLVTAASVLGLQCPLRLAQRLAGIGDPLIALEGAMSARLLELRELENEHVIAFPHALTRAAVYHDIGPARRASLHLSAAELIGDESASLYHRSAAAFGEDETLAGDLAGYATREAERGATPRAAAAMMRASRLSPAGERRERRLLESVDLLLIGGEVARAAAYAGEVRACADGPYPRYLLGRLAFHSGHPVEGERLLLAAWEARDAGGDRQLASKIASDIALVLVRRSRGPELVTWARRALAAAAGTSQQLAPWHMLAYGLTYAGRAEEGLSEIAFLPQRPRDLGAEDVQPLYARGLMRFMTDDLAGACADFTALVPAAARWGPFMMQFATICFLGAVEYRLGAWDDAIAHATLATSLCEDADHVWTLSWTHATAVAPLAGRGDAAAAQSHADAAARYARLVEDDNSVADVSIARAQIAAARADHEAVVDALLPVQCLPEREGIDEPGGRWPWQELLAEALIGLRRLDEAEAVLVPFEERAAARGRRSAMANAARVRGNLEAARRRSTAAAEAFCAGHEHAAAVTIPFDVARLDAAHGRFLRRLGKRAAAVARLKAARDGFVALGARPYLEAVDRELAVAGVTSAADGAGVRASLTPQEVAVARRVAQGLSNREVAAQLVVSVNTVEFHLKNIYSKLEVGSRGQLAARLLTT
ncbi:MAG TPA: AAA family ATPase [Candidatus Dormibacteraeota bacterium]|nr:AAA family ATPase [Candidatus Dormibacteraeota bacterium]